MRAARDRKQVLLKRQDVTFVRGWLVLPSYLSDSQVWVFLSAVCRKGNSTAGMWLKEVLLIDSIDVCMSWFGRTCYRSAAQIGKGMNTLPHGTTSGETLYGLVCSRLSRSCSTHSDFEITMSPDRKCGSYVRDPGIHEMFVAGSYAP